MDAIYISGNSFKVLDDRTAEFNAGRRVKLDCGLDGIKYATVVSSSYSSPYTTVVIDESDLTASLTSALYGVTQPGETGSFPDHTHDGLEGSGGTIANTGVSEFINLTDTPTTYSGSEGLYLRVDSTASGIEFAFVSASGTDDHSHAAYVPWNFGAGTISGTGDIYCNDIYTSSGTVYIGDVQLTTSGSLLLVDGQVYTNGADGAPGVSGTDGLDGADGSTTFSGLTDTPNTYDEGKYLISTATGLEWTTITVSGVAIIAKGKQSIQIEYATTSGIYINPGNIHMKDSIYGMYDLDTRLEVSFDSLSIDTWYYVYTNVSGSTVSLDATNFIAPTTTPTIDYPSMGWYNGSDRCIGAFITDGSGNIMPFYTDGNFYEYGDDFIDANLVSPGTTWTDVILTAPSFAKSALANFRASTFVANCVVYYRKNGGTGSIDVLGNNTAGRIMRNTRRVTMDSSQTIEFRTSVADANDYYVFCDGFYIPNYIYTGA